METEILLRDVSKFYGKKRALNRVSLTVKKGMFGLLGRNGAGKTTLMKLIATLLCHSDGSITVCGEPSSNAKKVREMVGYLPQDFSMYGSMTVYEAMDYLGVLSGMTKEERKKKIPELLERVNLSQNMRTKVKAMSGGMRRRLGIAQAILHDPMVLIVDEPTAGLDPEERVRFRNLLCEIAEDRIVLLSTHIVGDIEATCERIAILEDGNLLYDGTVSELLSLAEGNIYLAEVARIELDKIKAGYEITSMLTLGNQVQVRLIAEEGMPPFHGAEACLPNVEDAYLYYLHKKRGDL